jgi:hypothetical protein
MENTCIFAALKTGRAADCTAPAIDLVRVSSTISTTALSLGRSRSARRGQGLRPERRAARVSPDNTQVLFCLAKNGNFPIFINKSSDIYSFSLV